MGSTTFSGPIKSGTVRESGGMTGNANVGSALLEQQVSVAHNGASARTGTLYIPTGSTIVDIILDTTTAPAGSTALNVSVGTAAAGTQLSGATDVQAGGRFRPTFTAAQLTAHAATTQEAVFVTITPTGTSTAGVVRATIVYAQN
jgi:hypothetical protein